MKITLKTPVEHDGHSGFVSEIYIYGPEAQEPTVTLRLVGEVANRVSIRRA